MKRKDFLNEIRGLSRDDLKEKARGIAEELMKLRFRLSTGQLDQTHRVRELRRNFARIQTFLKEKPAATEQR